MNVSESRVSLVVVGGVYDGRELPVRLPFMLGRAAGCQLRPLSDAISSQHCQIEDRQGRPVIRDLGSTNGTFVNDVQILCDYPLRDGDELSVGPLQFIVRVEESVHITEEATSNAGERFLQDEDDEMDAKLPSEVATQESASKAKN